MHLDTTAAKCTIVVDSDVSVSLLFSTAVEYLSLRPFEVQEVGDKVTLTPE